MELTILGSGTGEPSLRRGFPGILMRQGRRIILIDSGSGTLRALLADGVSYREIDEIWYTHLHCDHVSELAPILFAMRNMAAPREKDLTLVGPPEFRAYYEGLLRLYGSTLEPRGYRVSLEEVREGERDWHGGIVASLPMNHTPDSVGYRFEVGGRSVAFSGDTAPCANIVELARGVDLLVLECSFPDGMQVEGHMTPPLAAAVAEQAGCARLLLTHFYPICDSFDILGQCRGYFSGEIIIADDGMKVEI